MKAFCEKCSTAETPIEFDSVKELFEHKKGGHTSRPKLPPIKIIEPKKEQEQPKPEPLILKYIYTGICPDDSSQVSTLEIDIAKKHFVIAVCLQCKKQLSVKEVIKL